jgi:hypothetical protein
MLRNLQPRRLNIILQLINDPPHIPKLEPLESIIEYAVGIAFLALDLVFIRSLAVTTYLIAEE